MKTEIAEQVKGFEAETNRLRTKNKALKDELAVYKGYFKRLKNSRVAPDFCLCGCGREIIRGKKGPRQKFYSDECRSRYHNMKKRLTDVKKATKRERQRQASEEGKGDDKGRDDQNHRIDCGAET